MARRGLPSTPEDVLSESPVGLEIYHRLRELVADLDVSVRATLSQVTLRRHHDFAYLWYPGRYLASDVPAVLSIALPEPLDSTRFKHVGNPSPHTWMHHLELTSPRELDDEVVGWFRAAYDAAG